MLKLFDGRIFLGRDHNLDSFQFSTIQSIKKMLDKYRVEKAILTSFSSFRFDFKFGNELIFEAVKEEPRLIPCPVVIPNSAGETGDEEEFIENLIKRGARCVSFHPKSFGLSIDEKVCGRLFKAISERRLPVIISAEELELEKVAFLAENWPDIPFIYSAMNYRQARNLYPILEKIKNLHIDIAPPNCINEGIEEMVKRGFVNQIIYASCFPISEPGAVISYLMYAKITEEEREKIAFGNMDRLVKGVKK